MGGDPTEALGGLDRGTGTTAIVKVRAALALGGQELPPRLVREPEIWARTASTIPTHLTIAVTEMLTGAERSELMALCGRCLYHTLTNAVKMEAGGDRTFVATGDIDDMWLRDSAVQLGVYFPRMAARPALRLVIEGAIRLQAFYILQDPYANAFSRRWRLTSALPPEERRIGRGGWVATRNYELDSGAYFLRMLWNYWATPGLFAPERFLNDSAIFEAAMLVVATWRTEQRHEERSPYRYAELPRDGLGPPSAPTGMSWSGYRPSDDAQAYGYNIPANMYAAGALEAAMELNEAVWRSAAFAEAAAVLAEEMAAGIAAWGTVTTPDGNRTYAYEVDGLGRALADFDDPNVPSLLAIPLLGFARYDHATYAATRARLLSPANPYFFSGPALTGLGSPHTPANHVWPLALMVQGLTSGDARERVGLLRQLLGAQCGDGLMHESVHATSPGACTRPWFEWANAMAVVFIENALAQHCDDAAEAHRRTSLLVREGAGAGGVDSDAALFYEPLEADVQFA